MTEDDNSLFRQKILLHYVHANKGANFTIQINSIVILQRVSHVNLSMLCEKNVE